MTTQPNQTLEPTPVGGFSSGWLPKPATSQLPHKSRSLRELCSRLEIVIPAWFSFFRLAASLFPDVPVVR